jgi:hypothetical protein
MQVPHIGRKTMAFAAVIKGLAVDGEEVVVEDVDLVARASLVAGREWLAGDQALREALDLLERLGAIEFDRRGRGRPRLGSDACRRIRVRPHWVWSVVEAESGEVVSA